MIELQVDSLDAEDVLKAALILALHRWHGNRGLAAREMKVSIRTVRAWIHKYRLNKKFPPQIGRKPSEVKCRRKGCWCSMSGTVGF